MTDSTQAFNGLAQNYDQARPHYPNELFKEILNQTTIPSIQSNDSDDLIIADVGCGTGISTRAIYLSAVQERSSLSLIRCFGVEPGEDMRKTAISKTPSSMNISYVDGSAENISLDTESVHVVTVAQAAHWFNRPVFYQEASRVLQKGGVLALYENNRDYGNSAFADAYETFLEMHAYHPETKMAYSRHYRDYPYQQEMSNYFGNCQTFHFEWIRDMHPSDYITMAKSSNQANKARKNLGDEEFTRQLWEIVNAYKKDDQTITVPYKTQLFLAVKQ